MFSPEGPDPGDPRYRETSLPVVPPSWKLVSSSGVNLLHDFRVARLTHRGLWQSHHPPPSDRRHRTSCNLRRKHVATCRPELLRPYRIGATCGLAAVVAPLILPFAAWTPVAVVGGIGILTAWAGAFGDSDDASAPSFRGRRLLAIRRRLRRGCGLVGRVRWPAPARRESRNQSSAAPPPAHVVASVPAASETPAP